MKYSLSKDQEEDLNNALGNLGKAYNLYRQKVTEEISSFTKDEWASQLQAKKLPPDEMSSLYKKVGKLYENPSGLEHFHRTVANSLSRFLEAPVDYIEEKDHLKEYEQELASELNLVTGDKIKLTMNMLRKHLKRELERVTISLILLYEEEEQSLLMKEKRIKGLLRHMKQERYLSMNLQSQIKMLETHRKDLIEHLSFFTLPDSVVQTKHEDFLEEFLKVYTDNKDYIYSIYEDRLVDLLIEQVLRNYKEASLNLFIFNVKQLSFQMYLRDYAFTVDRYFTNALVKGSKYISNKKTMSNIEDGNLISVNMMEKICNYSTTNFPHRLIKYSSNQYFDNVTLSSASFDIIYNCFTCGFPRMILFLKNLYGSFLDEVDNSDNLTYDNPLDVSMSILFSLKDKLKKTIFEGVFGPNQKSIITSYMVNVKRSDFVSSVMVKFNTGNQEVSDLHQTIEEELQPAFNRQVKYLQFYDYYDVDKLLIHSDKRFKMKDKSNPNQNFIQEINDLKKEEIIKIKTVPSIYKCLFEKGEEIKCAQKPPFQEIIVHTEITTVFESLMNSNFEMFKERMEVYLQKRMKEVESKPVQETNPAELAEVCRQVFETNYGCMYIASRAYLIRIISYLNYMTSVRMMMHRRANSIQGVSLDYERIETCRFPNIKDVIAENKQNTSQPRATANFPLDDSRLGMESSRLKGTEVSYHRKLSIEEFAQEDDPILEQEMDNNEMDLDLQQGAVGGLDPGSSRLGPGGTGRVSSNRFSRLSSKMKDSHIFDDYSKTDINEKMLLDSNKEDDSGTYYRLVDHSNSEIVYDRAVEEFASVVEEMKRVLSYFIQFSLVDYCYDSVDINEHVSADRNNNTVNHSKIEIRDASHHLHYEYIVYEMVRYECLFQNEKSSCVELYVKCMDNSSDSETSEKYKGIIEGLVSRRPSFDVNSFQILNETISEICNQKTNHSSISTKDVCREIQNFVITVFDYYKNEIEYFKKQKELVESILEEQVRLWKVADGLTDIRKSDEIGAKKMRKYMELIDNTNKISEVHAEIEKTAASLCDDLISFKEIDMNTLNEIVVEENKEAYYKTIMVKYLAGASGGNVLGKGVKESTYTYILRLIIQNRLMNRKQFIKGCMRLNVINSMKSEWEKIMSGTASDRILAMGDDSLLDANNITNNSSHNFVESHDKMMKDTYYSLKTIVTSLEDEKKAHIYEAHKYINRQPNVNYSKSKLIYSKNEWKNKVGKINHVFICIYNSLYTSKIRHNANCMSVLAECLIHQDNMYRVKKSRIPVEEGEVMNVIESILDMKDLSGIRMTTVQRILRSKIIGRVDMEEYQKKMMMMGDSKFINEYLVLARDMIGLSIKSNSYQWSDLVRHTIQDLSNIMPNSKIVSSVITSNGIIFDRSQLLPVVVSESETNLLITSIENNEIILGSENESIIRRMVLQTLMDHHNEVCFDSLAELKKIKQEVFNKAQGHSNRKVNYMTLGAASKTQRGPNRKRMSISTDIPICQMSSAPELSNLLVRIMRLNEALVVKNRILIDNRKYEEMLHSMYPYSGLLKRNVLEPFLSENLNLYFWKCICQRLVFSERIVDKTASPVKVPPSLELLSKSEKEMHDLMVMLGIDAILPYRSNMFSLQFSLNSLELNKFFLSFYTSFSSSETTMREDKFFPKIDIFDIAIPNTMFAQEIGEVEITNQSNLSKLLGNIQQKKKKEKGPNTNTSDQYLSDEIKILGRNYLKNIITYVSEECDKEISSQSKNKAYLSNINRIKFKTGSLSKIQFEEPTEEQQSLSAASQEPVYMDLISTTQMFKYHKYAMGRRLMTFSRLVQTRICGEMPKESPVYLLRHITSIENSLKKDDLEDLRYDPKYEGLIAKKVQLDGMCLKLIDYNSFDEILAEFDRYVKEARKKPTSPLYSYMKTNSLYSVVYSRPSDESMFRHMDIRVRIYMYDLSCQVVDTAKRAKSFFETAHSIRDSEGVDEQDKNGVATRIDRLKEESIVIQRTLVLAFLDICMMFESTDEKASVVSDQAYSDISKILKVLMRDESCNPRKRRTINTYDASLFNRLQDIPQITSEALKFNNIAIRFLDSAFSYSGLSRDLSVSDQSTRKIVSLRYEYLREKYRESNSSLIEWCIKSLYLMRATNRFKSIGSEFSEKNSVYSPQTILGFADRSNDNEFRKGSGVFSFVDRIGGVRINEKDLPKLIKYSMTKIHLNSMMQESKYQEVFSILSKFRESNGKETQEVSYKNTEYDHITNMYINFIQMARSLDEEEPASEPYSSISLLTETEFPNNNSFYNSISVHKNMAILASSYVYLLYDYFLLAVNEQTEIFKYLVGNTTTIQKPAHPLPDPVSQGQKKASGWAEFQVNLSRFVNRGYTITTNEEDIYYIISRKDMVECLGKTIGEASQFIDGAFTACDRFYSTSYVQTQYRNAHSADTLRYVQHHMTYIIHDYHKIIESYLSEFNFNIIYDIDVFYKFIKYMIYDSNILYDYFKTYVNKKYVSESLSVMIEEADVHKKDAHFLDHMKKHLKDYKYIKHNQNMFSLYERMQRILENEVQIVNEENGADLKREDMLEAEHLASLNDVYNLLIFKFRERYSKALKKFEATCLLNSKQADVDDGMKKKIRELTVREVLLKNELGSTKHEMDALVQQNSVLERDIHICNFERINLTRQLHELKEKLEKAKSDLMKIVSTSIKKTLLPPISGGLKIGQIELGGHQDENRISEAESDISSGEEDEEEFVTAKKTQYPGNKARFVSKKKKNKFVFVNGRLEKKYSIK